MVLSPKIPMPVMFYFVLCVLDKLAYLYLLKITLVILNKSHLLKIAWFFYCNIQLFENKKKTPKVAEVLPWAPNLAPARHKLGRHGLVLSCTLK